MNFTPGEKVFLNWKGEPFGVAIFLRHERGTNRWVFRLGPGDDCYFIEDTLDWVERLQIEQDVI